VTSPHHQLSTPVSLTHTEARERAALLDITSYVVDLDLDDLQRRLAVRKAFVVG
jgi:hypothetical protein